MDVWNHYDAKAFASLLTEDGEWRDMVGQTAIGRKELMIAYLSFHYSIERNCPNLFLPFSH